MLTLFWRVGYEAGHFEVGSSGLLVRLIMLFMRVIMNVRPSVPSFCRWLVHSGSQSNATGRRPDDKGGNMSGRGGILSCVFVFGSGKGEVRQAIYCILKVVSVIFFRPKHKLSHSSGLSSWPASCPPHKQAVKKTHQPITDKGRVLWGFALHSW